MSAKNNDAKGRWRNKIVAFRVSPEEDALIETAVSLSGLTKQDYIIKKLTNKEVIVRGNPRVYKALKDKLDKVLVQLEEVMDGADLPEDFIEEIKLIKMTVDGLKEE